METFDLAGRWQEIVCMIPTYLPDIGNCSELWLSGGAKMQQPVKVESLLKALAKVFALDLTTLKQIQKQILKKGKLVPLPIISRLVLIPVKVRNQMLPGDGTIGYVAYRFVAGFEPINEEDFKSSIALENGQTLKTFHTARTLDERTHQAEIVLQHYKQLYQLPTRDSGSDCHNFNCPFMKNNN
ncbi:hypothetical protein MFMK1_002598 [Metallumcola ferriviriculae]|uniref:Uncharacterized protein n=1 Tax=Metallumcola ferriviriculae TaxID=3039180 RepID=A0AAU0USC9_9FIRM|nr:hypothetical protein MFMK1_002598 [Desulfitibacteraceae bacterium MK1]